MCDERNNLVQRSNKNHRNTNSIPGNPERKREIDRERERAWSTNCKLRCKLFSFAKLISFCRSARSTIRHIIQRGYPNALCNEKISRGARVFLCFFPFFFFFPIAPFSESGSRHRVFASYTRAKSRR